MGLIAPSGKCFPVDNALVAQQWIDAGLAVFPCCASTKRPKVTGWRSPIAGSASWSSHWTQSPGDMPGLDCQHARIVVVDCDLRVDRDGEAEFRSLCRREAISLANVPMVRTPSGGRHFYFGVPALTTIVNSAGRLAKGVDVRGEGGYVIVAGTARGDGGLYVPENPNGLEDFILAVANRKLPLLPDPLLRILSQARSAIGQVMVTPHGEELNPNRALAAGIRHRWDFAEACREVALAPAGTRNDALNRQAYIAGLRATIGELDPYEAAEQLAEAGIAAGLCEDEVRRTIQGALSRASLNGTPSLATYRPQGFAPAGLPWERTRDHALKRTFRNALLSLQALGVEAKRDTFSDKIVMANAPNSTSLPVEYIGPLTDNTLNLLRKLIVDTIQFDPGREHLLDAIKSTAEEARYDPVDDWLSSLKWDGVRRLHDWLPRLTGAPATKLFKRAGAALLRAMVMRASFPGSKFDLCIVLEGEQGCGKSSLLRHLASAPGAGYFIDAPGLVAMDNKTRAELIAGKWLVELAELSGLARSETEGVKAFLSQSSDQYRPPYGAVAVDRARRCVFVATTNARTYLPDATGNRRFLPVPCRSIDLKSLLLEREQLFAEAKVMVGRMVAKHLAQGTIQLGRPLPHDVAAAFALPQTLWTEAATLADDRRLVDPVEEALPDVVEALARLAKHQLADGRTFIRSADLLSHLRVVMGGQVRNNGIAGYMAKLGWSTVKHRTGGRQERGYAR